LKHLREFYKTKPVRRAKYEIYGQSSPKQERGAEGQSADSRLEHIVEQPRAGTKSSQAFRGAQNTKEAPRDSSVYFIGIPSQEKGGKRISTDSSVP
jgi:hypothetical protein